MDTVMTITAYGDNSETAVKAAEKEINRLDSLFSAENKNSEIYQLNSKKKISPVKDTLALINRSVEVSRLTKGCFDITTRPLTVEWGFVTGRENRVPNDNKIKKILKNVGYKNISVSDDSVSLYKNTSVDLGGIAKGYASLSAAEILKKYNITSAIISLGGNVRAVGKKPDGSNWIVGITDPDNKNSQIGSLSVSDTAVITSGGYQRYFEENGRTYHHIIDPHTGYPSESGLKSVTVVSTDDAIADALSTGLFVMGLDKGADLYRENSSLFGAVFITDQNKIYVTQNIDDKFSSEKDFEVIK